MTDNDLIPHPLWKVDIDFGQDLTGDTAAAISDALEEACGESCLSVFVKNLEATDGDRWIVSLTTMGPPDEAVLREKVAPILEPKGFHAEKLPETDWLLHVHENFPPVTLGGFFIYGSHYEGPLPPDKIALKIDTATAFGSGEHETTKGCLIALEDLSRERTFKNALDMGCGSGILAIAMQKLWPQIKLTAIDIDPESVTVTKRHADMNGITLDAAAGDGYRTPLCENNAPYGLVAANILAGPLVEMAGDLAKNLEKGGYAVLSGLLARQEADVTAAQQAAGLECVRSIAIGDWRALVFKKT